jgi:hypothetical protein
MSSFLLELELGLNRAGCHRHRMISRIFVQCAGGRDRKDPGGRKAQARIGNSHYNAVLAAKSFHEKADLSQAGFAVSVEWSY